jgi:threonylcarbamoyladenosine tRNA methylthiotransferase MtaB
MKIFFDTVGCRLNQAEIEQMARVLRQAGHQVVALAEEADVVIVNSCAVTAAASSDSRQKVRHAFGSGASHIILTGCWATLYPQEAAALEGVTEVVANLEKMSIPAQLLGISDDPGEGESLARQPLPGVHHRTRAFIKVQDGCDNHCTYCVTRIARGQARSIDQIDVLREVQEAVDGGAKEVVLTGVNLGAWGQDFANQLGLADLLHFLLEETPIERLRLSSLEPWDISPDFFDLWQNPRLCPHLHLPLQSGSGTVLHRMVRKTSPQNFRTLVESARSHILNLAITTDLIVGFPGETDAEFAESLAFVQEMQFSGGHVFRYSRRPGTPAAVMPGQVHGDVSSARAQQVRLVMDAQEEQFLAQMLGTQHKVLWENSQKLRNGLWVLEGYSENYARVRSRSTSGRWNMIDTVRITQADGKLLIGEIQNGESDDRA